MIVFPTFSSWTRLASVAWTAWLISGGSLSAQPYGLEQRPAVGAFLNGALPQSAEGGSPGWTVVQAFPNLTFDDPVTLMAEPRTNRLYVTGRQGTIHFFENNPATTTKTLFLDLTPVTQGYDDCGLMGFAFHPEYGIPTSTNRGFVYVYYQYSPSPTSGPNRPPSATPGYNRLSRFTVPDGSLVANRNSELILINQYDRHVWHNGGAMFFGQDGFLYLSNGDEGAANDSYNQTQEINASLFSGVLRIDVDQNPNRSHPIRRQPLSPATPPTGWPATFTANYYIPNDNPWLDPGGSILEEFYCIGLRSPHRMTRDPVTGRIWLGDVGQGTWEEVDIIEKGGNYQWAYREGNQVGPKAKPNPLIGVDKPPVHDYLHSSGNNCVIGGYVYRGSQHPSLFGKYIFGDNGSGRIWTLEYDGTLPATVTYLVNMPSGANYTGLSSFGVDNNNELYMLKMGRPSRIYKLANTGTAPPEPPALLSLTGAFTNLATLATAPGLIPFTVNAALWSDGADKQRWLVVPNDGAPYTSSESIGFTTNGAWTWPIGSVLVKHFELSTNDTNPLLRKRLETRFLVRATNDTWYGFTYKWRPDHSNADLLATSWEEPVVITTPTGVRTQTWYYPSRQDCLICHNDNAGNVLGPRTCQMNGDLTYPQTGVSDNQLRTMNHLGLFTPALNEGSISSLPKAVAITNASASLETRVRSYLDANCSQCHRPNGVNALFDARFDTPLANQGLIDGDVANPMGIAGAKIIAPGSVSQSLLHVRDSLVGTGQMPPLARNLPDQQYLNVLTQYILQLAPSAPTTIGNTTDGTQPDVLWSGGAWINAGRFPATADLTVTSMVAKVTAITGRYKCAIYADSGGLPGQLLRSTAEVINPGNGWQSFPLTSSLLLANGQFYWLAIWSDASNAQVYYSGNNGTLRWGQYNYGNWPSPFNTTGGSDYNYCIYASGFVAPTLTSIAVTPANATIAGGTTQQFTATGTYSDASTQNVTSQATWVSSNAIVATVSATGLATGGSAGTTTIAAALNGVTGVTLLTVGKSNAVVNLASLNQVYDGTPRQATATTVPAGLPVAMTYAGSATAPINGGSYQVIGTVNHPNYAGAATNTLTITPHPLSVVTSNASRVQGEPNPVFGGTVTGVQGGDNLSATYSTVATTASPVGVYAIVPALVDPDGKQSNYSVTLINGVLTIVAAPRLLSLAESSEGTFTSTWQVHPERSYQFQYKENLTEANWTAATNFTTAPGELSVMIQDEIGTNRHRFYRLRDVTPP